MNSPVARKYPNNKTNTVTEICGYIVYMSVKCSQCVRISRLTEETEVLLFAWCTPGIATLVGQMFRGIYYDDMLLLCIVIIL